MCFAKMTNESGVVVTKNGKKSSDSGEEKANLSADVSLPAEVLEKLYQSYTIKQKRDGLSSFLIASIMFDLWAIIVPQGQRMESLCELIFWFIKFFSKSFYWSLLIERLIRDSARNSPNYYK